jgi:hypothetical protein
MHSERGLLLAAVVTARVLHSPGRNRLTPMGPVIWLTSCDLLMSANCRTAEASG